MHIRIYQLLCISSCMDKAEGKKFPKEIYLPVNKKEELTNLAKDRGFAGLATMIRFDTLVKLEKKTLTFTPQALFEICEEIVKKCKKCMNQDPSMSENVMWDSLEDDWLDWIEDKSLEALKK